MPSKRVHSIHLMKHLLLPVAVAALTWFGATPEASARPHRDRYECNTHFSHYAPCGCPVYVERYVAFFDEYGDPVWKTRVIPVAHHCEPSHECGPEYRYREVRVVERRPPPPPIVSGGITIEASW